MTNYNDSDNNELQTTTTGIYLNIINPLWAADSSFHNNKQLKNSLLGVLQVYLGLVVSDLGRYHKRSTNWEGLVVSDLGRYHKRSTNWEILKRYIKVQRFMQVNLKYIHSFKSNTK